MEKNYYDIDGFSKIYLSWRENQYSANEMVEKPNILRLLPEIKGKRVLDLGCGFGIYTKLLYDMGASQVVGIDPSKKMIELAEANKENRNIIYNVKSAEEINYISNSFDLVISNLVFHYIKDIKKLFANINNILTPEGYLLFSVEHPTSTASYNLGWKKEDNTEEPIYWCLDNYGIPGERQTKWMEHIITKYHRTIEIYCNELLQAGFTLQYICEAIPNDEDIKKNKDLKKYLKRPLYLIIKARKN